MLKPADATRLVNAVLVDKQIKPVRQQMIYNYTKGKLNANEKPLIKCELVNGECNIDRDDLVRWLKQYIDKKLNKVEHEPLSID